MHLHLPCHVKPRHCSISITRYLDQASGTTNITRQAWICLHHAIKKQLKTSSIGVFRVQGNIVLSAGSGNERCTFRPHYWLVSVHPIVNAAAMPFARSW